MLAIIGGTGFGELAGFERIERKVVETHYGDSYVELGDFCQRPTIFLPRHGNPPRIPPHKINYRANLKALSILGVDTIIAVTAVGSVDPALSVGDFIVPEQIIDYTYGRDQTFFELEIGHVDFTYPFSGELRDELISALAAVKDCQCVSHGIYGCTQGPRLETAAEIQRLHRDGCTIVGMTAMPEAALARELDIAYGGVSVVVNKGAGIEPEPLDLNEIEANLKRSMDKLVQVLRVLVTNRT